MPVKFNRVWAMPSTHTFLIKPIKELIERYDVGHGWIDPFAGFYSPAHYRNDMNPETPCLNHMDAIEYLKTIPSLNEWRGIIRDPPYSVRQVAECYKQFGHKVTQEMTQAKWYRQINDEIARIAPPIVICCGWNSGGVGKKNGYELIEVLLVAHGGVHNDTIVTVEKRL